MSLQQDPPTVRKRRLMESIELISKLLEGRTVTQSGEFFKVKDACVTEPGMTVPC